VKDPGAAARVATLRAGGMSLRAIAKAEGMSASGVRKMRLRVDRVLEPVED
jgi:lambda repressor-like predicted transcriptional regulator